MLIEITEILEKRIEEVDEDIRKTEQEIEELKELEEYYQRIVDAILVSKHNNRVEYDMQNYRAITSKPRPLSTKLLETEQDLKEEIKEIGEIITHKEEKIKSLKHTKLNISHKLKKQIEKKPEKSDRTK